ncbi:protein PET117 homolog, mitochondrial-like [Uranotaenia lowii]|uniref:protein PET117 homolog, mitochondrial-like n=1 Tax=Uranotaenia lowii TaxID=190385 RepID=UPI00247870C4|nr:protein PET117 homolog, mitochondrial-like [Uranotaenia lowii]XP_055603525.1 protein PET117 homolog, mitochondrial-like [Uranotaenia lowii]
MSSTSKVVFLAACAGTAGIIGYVHYRQNYDRAKLHEGVIRDIQRQQQRKIENTYNLQQQIELTKQLRHELEESEKKLN